jgi:hypothetical protein
MRILAGCKLASPLAPDHVLGVGDTCQGLHSSNNSIRYRKSVRPWTIEVNIIPKQREY